MPGPGDLLGILEVKEMRGRPRQAEAKEMLEKLRDQASQIQVVQTERNAAVCAGERWRWYCRRNPRSFWLREPYLPTTRTLSDCPCIA